MDKDFYIENRRKLAENLKDGDLMLFFSGESVRKTADENYPFFTNRNFLYLSGVQQEQCTGRKSSMWGRAACIPRVRGW